MDPTPAPPVEPLAESPSTLAWFGRRARMVVIAVIGATLLLIGLVLVAIPGPPGWPLVLAGMGLLATEFAWARGMMTGTRQWLLKRGKIAKPGDDSVS